MAHSAVMTCRQAGRGGSWEDARSQLSAAAQSRATAVTSAANRLIGEVVQSRTRAFSVIVKTDCETDGSFHSTSYQHSPHLPRLLDGGALLLIDCGALVFIRSGTLLSTESTLGYGARPRPSVTCSVVVEHCCLLTLLHCCSLTVEHCCSFTVEHFCLLTVEHWFS